MSEPFVVCAAITVVSAFISLGFATASLLATTGLAHTASSYAWSRSIALAVLSLVPPFTQSIPWLVVVAAGMIIVQLIDALIGAANRNTLKTFGPAATAIVNVAALIWLVKS